MSIAIHPAVGVKSGQMSAVRSQPKALELRTHDCLSPPLMDLIATHTAKAKGQLAA
jgi:S-(hydroxymethyl)glutathione synthase